jgi:hypothetical protein
MKKSAAKPRPETQALRHSPISAASPSKDHHKRFFLKQARKRSRARTPGRYIDSARMKPTAFSSRVDLKDIICLWLST